MEKAHLIVVYFGFVIRICVHGQVTLSIYPRQVSEYSSQTLSCTYSGNGIITGVTWKESRVAFGVITTDSNTCNPFLKPDPALYSYSCSSGTKTFTLTILSVTRAYKGKILLCSLSVDNSSLDSNTVSPDIIVPITNVTMTQPETDVVTVQLNTKAVFVCETSGGLPVAQVTWFKDSGTPDNTVDDTNITVWSTSSTSNTSDNLTKVTSSLDYSPLKSDRNMRIYCKANNGGSTTYTSSSKPLLDVQYPPEAPPVIQQGTTFNITEQTLSMLSCSVTGGNPLANLTWNCYTGVITDRTSGETVTKEISWTASRGQDGSCTCVSTHYNWSRSVSTRIEILYPPSKPTFSIGAISVSGTVMVIQNKTLIINCNSNSKPPPTYTWRYNDTTTDGYQKTIPNIQTSNNGLYTCESKNTMVPSVGGSVTGKQNSSITVQVLYPPRIPQFRYGTMTGEVIGMNTLEVIKDDSFNVTCVSEGEPTPQYQWSQQSGYSQLLSVMNIIEIQTRTCTVNNTMREFSGEVLKGVQASDLQIFVMYAPTTPLLSFKNQAGSTATVTNNHRVIENTTFSVSCFAYSRPSPSYNWSSSGSSISNTLSLTNVKRSQRGLYTCDVSNAMRRTFSNPEQEVIGRNRKNFTLDILYAPVVHSLASEDIAEGQTFTKLCEVTPGNPSTTTFTWTKVTDIRTWQTQTLSIINVSRSNASNYTCTAKNTMTPTVESEVTGEDSKSFFLNVLYSSSITLFTLNGVQESSIVSENDTDVPVICGVDSNPGSVITIEHDGTTLLTQNDAKHLNYYIARAQCTDAGYYRCNGRNKYNSQPAVKEIRLFVKCSPRPSPYVPLNDRVRTGLHNSTTLKFSALSYPEPTAFKWFKKTDSALIPIENTNNTLITSKAVNTSLTIFNVTESLFGEYLLTVHNERGVWNQSYYIEAYDFPFPPTNFKLSIIHGVSVLSWESSFNGGYEQSFLIQTSQEGTDIWSNLTLIHESDEAYKISTGHYVDVVTDQPSGVYRCRLIAVNSRGNAEAVYLTRPMKINRPYPDGKIGDNSALITGIVLGIFVIVLVVCVILLVVKLRRTSNIKGEYMPEQTTSRMKLPVYVNTEFKDEPKEHGARQSRNMRGIRAIHGDGTSQRDGEYSSLDQRLRDNSATYDVINSRQIAFT